MRPQAVLVELGNFAQCIKAPAMGIAGERTQRLEFSEDGEIRASAKNTFEFGQIRNFVTAKMAAQSFGIESHEAHYVIVRTPFIVSYEL